jgi:hypothetical protein
MASAHARIVTLRPLPRSTYAASGSNGRVRRRSPIFRAPIDRAIRSTSAPSTTSGRPRYDGILADLGPVDWLDVVRGAPSHEGAVARPGRAVRPADRPNLLLHVLPEGRCRHRCGSAEPAGDEGLGGPGRRARADRLRGRGSGRLGIARASGGLRQAPAILGHEAGGRPTRMVHRVLLRRPRCSWPGFVEPDAPGRRGLCAVEGRPPRRGLPGGQGRAKPPGRHVLRREIHIRPCGVPGGGPPETRATGDAQGPPATTRLSTSPASAPKARHGRLAHQPNGFLDASGPGIAVSGEDEI